MRRTDKDLHRDVVEELTWQPSIREAEIGVAVKDGVATLSGFVETYAQKRAAERAAMAVRGVRSVAEGLKVRVADWHVRSDTDIAHQAVNSLDWDVEVPRGAVKARVESGRVTLEGEVEWHFQREAAVRAIRNLAGVLEVTNLITLRQHSSATDVTLHIQAALRRSGERGAPMVEVEAHGGTVTLRGQVRSWAERRDVERAAWAAGGVTQVNDLTAVMS
jgi:osmotically-inducible protein OsmY